MSGKRIEEIGRVRLDLSKYSGKDYYSEGEMEDLLLEIVKSKSAEEYDRVIEEQKNWPVLYHLSSLRENIVDWIPMDKSCKVLEVGSGCGAITGALARKAGEVTCVELSKKRSTINAWRHRECDNITIHVGNFREIEPELPADYDYICLIGVFEYGQSYIGGDRPYEEYLTRLMAHLAPGGRLVIAIENKYGLKYFAGCREDHLGTYFSGIENYAAGGDVRTFGRGGLEKIFADCGAGEYHFYYPYPDYKFMTALYSDAYLPGKGELFNNIRNFDRDRMLLFDEKNAFDGLTEEGLFPVFSNSYLAVVGRGFDIKFVKYSNDRAPEYAIRTEIRGSRFKNRWAADYVRKYPMSDAAQEHIRGMAAAYESLKERYQGGRLEINKCELLEDNGQLCAQFEYVEGVPLLELMDRCLEKNDLKGFRAYFRQFVERVGYNSEYPAADFDLVFGNILVSREDSFPEEEAGKKGNYQNDRVSTETGAAERAAGNRASAWPAPEVTGTGRTAAEERAREEHGASWPASGETETWRNAIEESAGERQASSWAAPGENMAEGADANGSIAEKQASSREGNAGEENGSAWAAQGENAAKETVADREKWTLIDYEWTFGKPIDSRRLAFRAAYWYLKENEKRKKLDLDWVRRELGISEKDVKEFWEQEGEFQRFVTGERSSMAEMREKIGRRVVRPQDWLDRYQDSENVNRVQIYEDRGQGYREEDSYYVQNAYQGDWLIELELQVDGEVEMLRIDPGMYPCMVKIREMTFNGETVPLEKRRILYANGRILKPAEKEEAYCPGIVFPTEDPNINIALKRLERKEKNTLRAKIEIVRLPLAMARDMAGRI